MKDPYVEEVRKHRMEHTRQFNSNLHLICEDLREFESCLRPTRASGKSPPGCTKS